MVISMLFARASDVRPRIPAWLVLVGASLLLALWSHAFVPYNDDEFLPYRPILCGWYENSAEDMCAHNWLKLPLVHWEVPLRAFWYVGSAKALLYFPLFLLWPSPISQRFLNFLLLAVQAWILGKTYKRSPLTIFAGILLFFPYALEHVIDTGPVAVQTTIVLALAALLRQWMSDPRRWHPLLVAGLIFLGVWSKLNFFWLLPAIFVLFLSEFWTHRAQLLRDRAGRVRMYWQILSCGALTGALVWGLLAARHPVEDAYPLWDQVRSSTMRPLSDLLLLTRLPIIGAFLNPLEAVQRVYAIPWWPPLVLLWSMIVFLVLPFVVIAPSLRARATRFAARRAAIAYGCFLLTAAAITMSSLSAAMHHAVLAFPFLILAVLEIFPALETEYVRGRPRWTDTGVAVLLGLLVASCMLTLFAVAPLLPVKPDSDPRREQIRELLEDPRFAQNYVYAVSSWGMFFEQALYGHRDQSVLFLTPDQHRTGGVPEAKQLANALGRKLLVITNKRDTEDLAFPIARRLYGLRRCAALPAEHPWQIYLEHEKGAEHPCGSAPSTE